MMFTIAQAATPGAVETAAFVTKFNEIILFPVITLLMGVAILVFLYGCAVYIVSANNPSGREDGRRHILYGIIGLLIMLMAYAILSVAVNTFGLGDNLECADDPTLPGCSTVFRIPDPGPSRPATGPDPDVTPLPTGPDPAPTAPATGPTPFPTSAR